MHSELAPRSRTTERPRASVDGSAAPARTCGTGRARDLQRLVQRVAADGDHAALALLYDATHRWVLSFVQRLLADRELAEEVTLDVFLQVWRKARSFDPERGDPAAWIFTLARSRALDSLRSRSTRRAAEAGADQGQRAALGDCTCDPHTVRVEEERRACVRSALSSLPAGQRRAIELAYFPGLSHTEIAAQLGEPLGTVKTRIRLGLIKLREVLRPLESER